MPADDALLDDIEARVAAGETITTIAAELGLSDRTMRAWFASAGRPSPVLGGKHGRRRALINDRQFLQQRYVVERVPPGRIAAEVLATTGEVHAALDRFGLERPHPNPLLRPEALREAFTAGGSVKSIAKAAGIDRTAVRRAMRRAGISNLRQTSGR